MKYLVNSDEMKAYDTNTITTFQIPSLVLMERAALEVMAVIREEQIDAGQTILVCGSGNNGGDGLALARLLYLAGSKVQVVLCGSEEKRTSENNRQLAVLQAYGIQIETEFPKQPQATLVVDALFGIGLKRKIEGKYHDILQQMNATKAVKLAIDIPSGINATDASLMGICFKADYTVTFAYGKIGMYLWPANEVCGKISVRQIGIDERSWKGKKPNVAVYTKQELAQIPSRQRHSNKGTYGKVLLIAGSKNMAGAAVLSARASYVTGCGLVRIFTPEENRIILQTAIPEAVLTTYKEDDLKIETLQDAMKWADVIACGSGIGTGEASKKIVEKVLETANVPVVLDADALNILAAHPKLLKNLRENMVITPHLGEMSRLCGEPISAIQTQLLSVAKQFTDQYHATCVLKDSVSVIQIPDGSTYLNLSGTNGMATAGSGDVLTGIISSLLAQGMNVETAAPLGVFLHGLSGEEAAENVGNYSMLAEDIINGLKKVLRNIERHEYE